MTRRHMLYMREITKIFTGLKALSKSVLVVSLLMQARMAVADDTNVYVLNTKNAQFEFSQESCDMISGTLLGSITYHLNQTSKTETWRAIKLADGEQLCSMNFKTFVREGFLISEKGSVLFRANEMAPFQYDNYDRVISVGIESGSRCKLQKQGLSQSDQKCLVLTRSPDDCRNAKRHPFQGYINKSRGMLFSSNGAVVISEIFQNVDMQFLAFLGLNDFKPCET